MILQGSKVVLRAMELEDQNLLRELINSTEIEKMVIGYSFPVSRDEQIEWIKKQYNRTDIYRAIIEVNGEGIGVIMLSDIDMKNGSAEIHIKIRLSHGHKGYGTDAIAILTKYAFEELRLHCLYCNIRDDNIPSQKMFEKCGYRLEGVLLDRVYKEGNYYSLKSYAILNTRMI